MMKQYITFGTTLNLA
uniref:Uncharacterized protein n=1 Tax=Arundo donax TaxID=35708 RepID=A0A0A8Z8J8_ARUDO